MLVEEILERNRRFTSGRAPSPFPEPESKSLAVLTCYDPRLDDLVLPSLGLRPGEAIVLRTAGAVLRPDGDPLRSLALAVYLFGVTEVVVVGHSSCRMASFQSGQFIEAFRGRGVPREGFGAEDLRAWAGAIPDPKRGVEASVAAIVSASVLPRDLMVAGFVLDETTGTLDIVAAPRFAGSSAILPEEKDRPAAASVPPASPAPAAQPLPTELSREIAALRSFVEVLESKAGWRDEVRRLREELGRHQSPLVRLARLESFVRRAAAGSREVAAAFERLKNETASVRGRLKPDDLVDLFRGEKRKAGS